MAFIAELLVRFLALAHGVCNEPDDCDPLQLTHGSWKKDALARFLADANVSERQPSQGIGDDRHGHLVARRGWWHPWLSRAAVAVASVAFAKSENPVSTRAADGQMCASRLLGTIWKLLVGSRIEGASLTVAKTSHANILRMIGGPHRWNELRHASKPSDGTPQHLRSAVLAPCASLSPSAHGTA